MAEGKQSTEIINPKKHENFNFANFSEQVLVEVNEMYNLMSSVINEDGSNFNKAKNVLNLRNIAESLNENLQMKNVRSTVLIIGNISAGKSTFVNWLAEEALQKTGMAIETSGFSIIRGGKYSNTLEGYSNILLNPHLADIINKHDGLIENINTKICTYREIKSNASISTEDSSNNKEEMQRKQSMNANRNEKIDFYQSKRKCSLKMVDLIDTPGLADGELQYPFDVENILLDFAVIADLIFVFFDPIGQALGSHIMNVVKTIHKREADKVRLCLTKVDDIPSEEERIKIMCQTTQIITSKINSRHGFDLIPIYVPGAKDGTYLLKTDKIVESHGSLCTPVNRIFDLVDDIEKAIEKKTQTVLNLLKSDTEILKKRILSIINEDESKRKANKKLNMKKWNWISTNFMLTILFILFCSYAFEETFGLNIFSYFLPNGFETTIVSSSEISNKIITVAQNILSSSKDNFMTLFSFFLLFFFWTVYQVMKIKPFPVLSKNELRMLMEQFIFVNECHNRASDLLHLYIDRSAKIS